MAKLCPPPGGKYFGSRQTYGLTYTKPGTTLFELEFVPDLQRDGGTIQVQALKHSKRSRYVKASDMAQLGQGEATHASKGIRSRHSTRRRNGHDP